MPSSVLTGRSRIASGQRNKRVQIEIGTPNTRGSGFPVEDWVPLGEPVWMSRKDTLGDERFAADQVSAWGQTRWEMAYQPDMDPELVDVMRVRRLNVNGRIFDIRAASLLDHRTGIALMTMDKAD
jgi:head-tail adaptor